MSVQATVAFLNKTPSSGSSAAQQAQGNVPLSKLKMWRTTVEDKSKQAPPLTRKEAPQPKPSNSVSSMLNKFAPVLDAPPVPRLSQSTKGLSTRTPTPPTRTPTPPTRTPTPPTRTPTPPTPPTRAPSPPTRTPSTRTEARTPLPHPPREGSDLSRITRDLEQLYKESLDQYAVAKETIQELEAKLESYSSDATKTRDNEIRVEYLTQKLEQISEERDQLEQELILYRQRGGSSLDTPVSGIFDTLPNPLAQSSLSVTSQEKNRLLALQEAENEAFITGILDAYEQSSSQDMDEFTPHPASHDPAAQEIARLTEQLLACDRDVQMTVEKYVTELEKERLATKTLSKVVKKQEELILQLENRLQGKPQAKESSASPLTNTSVNIQNIYAKPHTSTGNENLLREQVELQRIEIEDKREMLSHLLNERESFLKLNHQPRPSSSRSSIDVLAEIARPNLFLRNNSSQSSLLDANSSSSSLHRPTTPQGMRPTSRSSYQSRHRPMTPPPRQPPPPVPVAHASGMASGIAGAKDSRPDSITSSSQVSTSTSTSSTSWSSDDERMCVSKMAPSAHPPYAQDPYAQEIKHPHPEYTAMPAHRPLTNKDPTPHGIYSANTMHEDSTPAFDQCASKTSSMSSTSFLRLSTGEPEVVPVKDLKKHSKFWSPWRQK
ncbi:hypothetical protein BDF14DRAFT_250685 [Spinellus fusiger]|nr:hypothetical protein BDF14DRAFT_250685 [Spinellus fusiger]